MHLSNERLAEFKKLVKEHTGKDISSEEALKEGISLLVLIKAVAKQMRNENINADEKSD